MSVLLGVELGLLAGALISLITLLKPWTRPDITTLKSCVSPKTNNSISIFQTKIYFQNKLGQDYVTIKPELGLLFPAIDFISEKVLEQIATTDQDTTIIIDFSNILKVHKQNTKKETLFIPLFL